jgi:hypothetical protein
MAESCLCLVTVMSCCDNGNERSDLTMTENFLKSSATISFSRITLPLWSLLVYYMLMTELLNQIKYISLFQVGFLLCVGWRQAVSCSGPLLLFPLCSLFILYFFLYKKVMFKIILYSYINPLQPKPDRFI